MKNKIIKLIKLLFITSWLIFVLGFAINKKSELKCKDFEIILDNKHKFVNPEIIEKLLITNHIFLTESKIDSINFEKIENLIEKLNGVKDAQIYHDFDGKIYIEVKQRNPIMRIITNKNNHYYIDDEYKRLNISPVYTANVIVINGNLNDSLINNVFINQDEKSFENQYGYSFAEIFNLINYINNHEIWKYQFEQIFINNNYELELIPRVGEHVIILGTPENYKYKLGKLEAMYKIGFKLTDWNKYKSINLKFSNQVICKKK